MKTNRKKNKWAIVVFAVAILFIALVISGAAANGQATSVSYVELYPRELINSISIRGVIESAGSKNVYSNIGFTVKTVDVKVGDVVRAGQILCILDTEELENNIAQQRAQLNTSAQNIKSQILISSVNFESAQIKYDDARRVSGNATLLDLESKKTVYENNVALLEKGYISENELAQSRIAYTNALNNYNGTLEQTREALRTAQVNYDNAVSDNTETQILVLENLERQLNDSIIRAPASGTVTAVIARTGRPGSGLLFIIEDTDNLVIKTTIKEYDITDVRVGMDVIIRLDSTGNSVYEGVVSRIAPAAVKDANGETILGTDIEFEAQVDIISKQSDLRVGMNTRLNVILEKKDNVYSVPYDAIVTGSKGESSIFIAMDTGQNKQVAKQINVSTGLETDFLIEVSSPDLHNGIKIAGDASAIHDGMLINTNNGGSRRGQRN